MKINNSFVELTENDTSIYTVCRRVMAGCSSNGQDYLAGIKSNQGGCRLEASNLQTILQNRYPTWNIYLEPFGEALWISMNDGKLNYFEIQITPTMGVGITRRNWDLSIDFSGHDEAFNSLEETLDYLDRNIL